MKKNYLLGLLFTLTLTGFVFANKPTHEVKWLQAVNQNRKIDLNNSETRQSIDKLQQLRTTRMMFLQHPDRLTTIRTLKEINLQEKEIINRLNNKPVSFNTSSKLKAPISGIDKSIRNSAKEFSSPMKVGYTGSMKHLLDSFVVENKTNDQWKKQHKMTFQYNSRGQVTGNMSYDPDTLQAWYGTEKAFFTYDDSGRMTGREMQRWDNELSKWYVLMKMNVTFNEKGEMSSYETYASEFDQEKGEYELAGMDKAVVEYDANGLINQVTYYMWDYASSSWLQHMLMQMKVEGGIELMFASYVWNIEKNMWIGESKFEHEPIPEFGMMKSTYYRWNEITNEWVVNSKEEIVVGQDAFGVHFTITNYETDEETMVLHPGRKDKYSKPYGNDYLNEDNYGLKEVWAWDKLNSVWINHSKQENTFDSYGNITHKVQHEWLMNNTTNALEWILKFNAVNTINEIHKIGSSEETLYFQNISTLNYDLVLKKQFDYTYTLVGETHLMNQRSGRELAIGASEWKNTERYEVSYFANKEVKTEIFSYWDSGKSNWQAQIKNEFGYNIDLSLSLTRTDTWNSGTSS